MKKLNSILFSLIAPVVDGRAQSANAECKMQNAECGAELDEATLRAVYALAKKHDLGHLLSRGVRNAKCKMQNAKLNSECVGGTVGDGIGDVPSCRDRRLDGPKMQNAELSAEFSAELERAEMTAVWRVKNFENEQGRVRKCLENAAIPFILLKGAVIRDYYPEAWMRTSSDIDILVPADKLDGTVGALCDGIGCRISTREQYDASLIAPSGVHFDIHTRFEGDDGGILAQVWGNATLNAESPLSRAATALPKGEPMRNVELPVGDGIGDVPKMQNAKLNGENVSGGYERFLTDEQFYLYHVAHMAKHMRNGGCGIRPFIDLYLIRRHADYNRARLDSMLSEHGLSVFEAAAVALSEAWMCGARSANAKCKMQNAELNAELTIPRSATQTAPFTQGSQDAFEEYVLTGGVYGSSEQYVAARQRGKKHGKVRYILSRIFMPYEQLKERHPALEGKRWLTPVFEVWRWCGLLVPSRFKRGRRELSSAMRVDGARVTSVEELLDSLGL